MATPFAAQMGLPVLLAARACMGIGEGVAMPAMNNLLSRCGRARAHYVLSLTHQDHEPMSRQYLTELDSNKPLGHTLRCVRLTTCA